MILIENALVVTLAPMVTGRMHCIALPDDLVTYPAFVYSLIASEAHNTLCGESNLDNARYRIDLFGKDRASLLTLARSVKTAMDKDFPFESLCVGEYDLPYDHEERLYHRAVDFSIWANKPDTQSP